MILNRFTIEIFRIIYTVFYGGLLLIVYCVKGRSFFEKKEREQPECLKGWDSRYVKLKGIRLHYVQTGSDDKPLMLFIHGFPEFWYSWRFQLKEFQKDYRCVAIDQRGYNLSDKPLGSENYSIDYLTSDIKEVIETLNYEKATIVGHDWGALVAWQTAIFYPEVVEKLIILNVPRPTSFFQHLRTSFSQFRKSWYMFYFQSQHFPEMGAMAKDMEMLNRCFTKEPMGIKNRHNFTKEDLEAWKYSFSSNGASFKFPIHYYRNIFDSRLMTYKEEKLEMPILTIWGTDDKALEKEAAILGMKNVENGRIKFVEGASHWVQQDEPEIVNRHITEFLNESNS